MDGGVALLMISVSGVRGVIGGTLTPGVGVAFGEAFGEFLKTRNAKRETRNGESETQDATLKMRDEGRRPVVVVGRDTRVSGAMVFGAVSAGLMAVGVDVVDVGVATTPSVALFGRFLHADAAMVITASHNPGQWNGIKFLRQDGMAYPVGEAAEIKRMYLEVAAGRGEVELAGIEGLGVYTTDSRVHAHHVQTVLGLFDGRGIAEKRYRVVLDSVNGAGCIGTPMLLGKLGVELIHINGEGTGQFAHVPEPTKENLTGLCAEVAKRKAAVGFAQDPDADRLAIVDENGVYIGEEYTLALCTYARMLSKPGTVVTDLSTSRMVDDVAARYGQKVLRTAVGEANVAGKMMEVGAVIGGEGNGGVIDLRVGPVRDSFLGIAMVLDLMMRTGKRVSELVAGLPRYAMIKTKFECTPEQSAALVAKVKERFADQKLDLQDGVRIDWEGGWVHVRQSNTEPIARVIAEAGNEGAARELIGRVEGLR